MPLEKLLRSSIIYQDMKLDNFQIQSSEDLFAFSLERPLLRKACISCCVCLLASIISPNTSRYESYASMNLTVEKRFVKLIGVDIKRDSFQQMGSHE